MEAELQKRRIKASLTIGKIHELGCIILPKIIAMLTNDVDTDVYVTTLLNIQKLLALEKPDFNIHRFLYNECNIIDKLISYETNIIHHKMLISNVCQLIIRNLTIEEQHAIVSKYAAALNTETAKNDVALIINLLIPLRKDVNLNISSNMIENLYNLAISNYDQDTRQTICKFVSILLNKMEIADLVWVIPNLEDKINNNLKADTDVELKQYTIDLQIWITKALVMRGFEKSQSFLENVRAIYRYKLIDYGRNITVITFVSTFHSLRIC